MEKRSFGNSGLYVTPLGIGLAALGRPGYINLGHANDLNSNYDVKVMEDHTHEVLDAAWKCGIRYFDAARSYGRAEQFLSSWLAARGVKPNEITVGSKWGYTYTAGWKIDVEQHEVKDHSLPVLQKQFKESEQLLGDFLSLYQVHSATLDSGVLTNKEVLSELAKLRSSGLRLGLSLSGPTQADTLRQAMKIQPDGELLFSAAQATWNLLAQEVGEALAEATEMGMGIIIKEALANGRLTSRNREPAFVKKQVRLNELAQLHGTTIDAIALCAVLEQPWADVVLSGAATVQQLYSNVKALDIQGSIDVAGLMQYFKESPSHYWSKRSQLTWN